MTPFECNSSGWCVDDVKGGELLLDLIRHGRKAEIEECAARKGHEIRPRSKPRRRQARSDSGGLILCKAPR